MANKNGKQIITTHSKYLSNTFGVLSVRHYIITQFQLFWNKRYWRIHIYCFVAPYFLLLIFLLFNTDSKPEQRKTHGIHWRIVVWFCARWNTNNYCSLISKHYKINWHDRTINVNRFEDGFVLTWNSCVSWIKQGSR